MAGRWVDVGEAARELGISTDVVRKRIARGSLDSSRENGRVLVWLDFGGTEAGGQARVDYEALVENQREQVYYLRSILHEEREARKRADTIIAQLTQANSALPARVPEFESPQRSEAGAEDTAEGSVREAPPGATGRSEGRDRPPDTAEWPMRGGLIRPWWRRVFGG